MTLVKCAKLANKAFFVNVPFVKQREKKDVRVCVVLKEHATGNDRLGWTQEKDKKGTEIRSDAVSLRTTDAPKST